MQPQQQEGSPDVIQKHCLAVYRLLELARKHTVDRKKTLFTGCRGLYRGGAMKRGINRFFAAVFGIIFSFAAKIGLSRAISGKADAAK